MGVYLDKLRTTLSDIQSRQITDLLIQKKQSGEITTLEEFRDRLGTLTAKLLSENITPSLELFFGEFDKIINSDTFNFMLDRIRDDLEAAFSESNSLSEILDSHKNIINNVLLRSIRFGISELESKVSMYEFLARDRSGFDNAMFNTFKASQQLSSGRNFEDSSIIFKDPRSGSLVEDDAVIDVSSESLFLNNITEQTVIKSVRQVFDNEAPQSEDQVSFASTPIENIIDNSPGTYWTYSVLQKLPKPSVIFKIEFDLGNYTELNFLLIEGANIYPVNLERIEYIDSLNILNTLEVGESISNVPKNIYFNHIVTNKLFLVFSQKNFLEIQYEQKQISDNYDKAVLDKSSDILIDSISKQVRDIITSSKVLSDIFMLGTDKGSPINKFYDYSIGFDNIKLGHSLFGQTSIFVSSPMNVNNLAQLGLKTKEKRPVEITGSISITNDTYPLTDIGQYFHGSIEYWITLFNYDINNQLIDIRQVPILPLGVRKIFHENLILSNQISNSNIKNAGTLMFYCDHSTDNNLAAIKVYRNGTLLTHDIDWVIEDSITNDIAPPNGLPNKVGIKITSPAVTDFYTVTYSPSISNTRALPVNVNNINSDTIKIIDQAGDGSVRIGLDNILYINNHKDGGKLTDHSKIYLSIILRRSSPDDNLSPSVDEYLLSTSSDNAKQ